MNVLPDHSAYRGAPRSLKGNPSPWVLLVLATTYFLAAKVGLSLAFVAEQVTAVWPPTGIALAAVLLVGPRAWPGITLGAFVANVTAHAPIPTALGIAIGNTLEALVGGWLLNHVVTFDRSLQRVKDVLFLMLAAVASPTVSATIGVVSLCLGRVQSWTAFGSLWWVWWLGDATGALVVAPVFLTWAGIRRKQLQPHRPAEAAALFTAAVVTTTAVFFRLLTDDSTTHPLIFVIFPLVIWAALRFGQLGTASLACGASAIAIWGTVNGFGPFAKGSVNESLVLLQTFMAVVAGTGLILSAAIAESRRSGQRAAAQFEAASILARGLSLEEAAPRLIEAICRKLEWDVGLVWSVDREADSLQCISSWQPLTLGEETFAAASRTQRFGRGIGLPGRVWAGAKPLWLAEVSDDTNFPRATAAARVGLRGALGVPIIVDGAANGVMEFFSREARPPDDKLLETIAAIGQQVGQFIERKRFEGDLIRKDQELTDFIENATVGMHWVGPDGTILWANQAELDLLGYTREEYVGRHIAEFHADKPTIDDILCRLMNNEKIRSYEARLRCKDGSIRYGLISSSVCWENGQFRHTRCFTRDITERKLSEQKIADLNETLTKRVRELQTILDTVPVGISVAEDPAVNVITSNRIMAEMVGMLPGENISKSQHEPTRATYRVYKNGRELSPDELPLQRATGGAEIRGEVFDVVRADRSRITLLMNAMPILDEAGVIQGAVGGVADITALRQAEDALREADRRKDEFLAMLAHELRNPLSAISNAALVLKRTDEKEHVEWSSEVILNQVTNLSRMIDDLLDVSRITRGKIQLRKQSINILPVISAAVESVRPLIDARKHALIFDLGPGPIRVHADPTRLEQVLVNILTNAAKYTESSGRIFLSVRTSGADVIITLKDSGVGMTDELLLHAFDLFVQGDRSAARSEGGLGIGLTLVKNIVKMHGGTVTAASDGPGMGSEFTVRLPLCTGEQVATEGRTGTAPRQQECRRVLVVDDNADSARALAKLLKLLGHDVTMAHDGPSALEHARSCRPDVILLDIGLPGMDGFQVADALRNDGFADTLIIAISGYGEAQALARSREAGIDHHLVKPVSLDDLMMLLGKTLTG